MVSVKLRIRARARAQARVGVGGAGKVRGQKMCVLTENLIYFNTWAVKEKLIFNQTQFIS